MIEFYAALILGPPAVLGAGVILLTSNQDIQARISYPNLAIFTASFVVYIAMILLSFQLGTAGEVLATPASDSLASVSVIGAFLIGCAVSYIYSFEKKFFYTITATLAGALSALLISLVEGAALVTALLTWTPLLVGQTYVFFQVKQAFSSKLL